jgi:hypothetical protein
VVAASLLVSVCPAHAANVEVRTGDNGGEAYYVAGAGERNDILFSAVDDFTLRVADSGATITVGAGCRTIDEHTAECHYGPVTEGVPYLGGARVLAGDMDDVIRSSHERVPGIVGPTSLSGPGIIGNGGPGDDLLIGSDDSGDELDGGGGTDRLFGFGNTDLLTDGDQSGAGDADYLDGGNYSYAGGDTVSYAGRTAPVHVDLSDGLPDGETGEGDTLVNIGSVTGGSADDALRGDAYMNTLRGGAGNDRLLGGDGRDTLDGEAGDDRAFGQAGGDFLSGGSGLNRLSGSAGNDYFRLASGSDVVSCSRGLDVLIGAGVRDILARDCESLRYRFGSDDEGSVVVRPGPIPSRRGVVLVQIHCPVLEDEESCSPATGTVLIREARGRGAALGRGVIDLAGGETIPVGRNAATRVRLNARGRRLLRRRPAVLVTVSIRGFSLPTARWTTPLTAR